jgi:phosphoribosyl 1,2-cyclic phosphodiesterase
MAAQLSFPFDGRSGLGVQVLGSSSAGNATLAWSGREGVLVDCGFPPPVLRRRLSAAGADLAGIRGVLVTHAHGDHALEETIASLVVQGIPLVCPPGVASVLRRSHTAVRMAERRGQLQILSSLRGSVGPFHVEAFPVPHDAPGGCFGYTLVSAQGRITMATDLASTGNGLAGQFAGADIIVIESNHDPSMLESSRRPAWLKRRIRERGHLSNDACARFVVEVVERSASPPQAVLLAHISRECNTPALALSCTSRALAERGWSTVRVLETFPDRPSVAVEIP